MSDTDLAFASTTELRRLIAEKKVSPVEVTELYLSRIDELDPRLNSYLTLTRDEAMRSAKAAEEAVMRGEFLAPLHGVPISIKDLEITRGIRTTSGSLVFEDRIPDEDSVVVERVRGAGAVILGKTNTPELGLLGATENRLGDHCRNPWNTDRTTGGSSGGAGAAVAAGLCSLATGSDGGGSIRIPASFCGVYGIKPTQGRVPRYSGAAAPTIANQLSQSGPMTRTVRDSALLLQVLAGHDPRDYTSLRDTPPDFVAAADRDIKGLRVAWSPDFGYAAVEPEVVEISSRAAQVFEEMGCSLDGSDLSLDSPFDTFWTLFSANVYAANAHLLDDSADRLTWYALDCLEAGSKVTGADYTRALGKVDRMKAQFVDQFERYDLLLSPTMAVDAFPVGEYPRKIAGREVDPFWGYLPYTFPINMVGYPAASIPCGFSSDGLPVGLHVIGRSGDEATVIAASAAFEQARPWAQERPPVS
jgi:aspartyl-tRNA(Asn)/glutamyl-tRNA(Gln) amidotransferase subunit A